MIPTFIDRIAFLDIETTGLSPHYSHITTIAVYDGTKVHDFVRGDNLHVFPAFISKFPAITTFYGKSFDIPFIRHETRTRDKNKAIADIDQPQNLLKYHDVIKNCKQCRFWDRNEFIEYINKKEIEDEDFL